MTALTHGELFAGISGFGLGFDQAGLETKWHVEIDARCQSVLKRHYPDNLILSDIRDCGKHNLPWINIISFGSPCQGLSVAGARKGLEDDRSALFFEAIRVVAELKPDFAIWENVPGVFSSNSGRDFAAVLAAFQGIGAVDIAWRTLDAQYFNLAQRRRRVFLVADFRGERAAKILFERNSSPWDTPPRRETRQRDTGTFTVRSGKNGGGKGYLGQEALAMTLGGQDQYVDQTGVGINASDVGYSLRANASHSGDSGVGGVNTTIVGTNTLSTGEGLRGPRRDGNDNLVIGLPMSSRIETGDICSTLDSQSGPKRGGSEGKKVLTQSGVRRLTPLECEKLQGFPPRWTEEGQSDSARYRQLGNAVAVPVAKWIGRRLQQCEGTK